MLAMAKQVIVLAASVHVCMWGDGVRVARVCQYVHIN